MQEYGTGESVFGIFGLSNVSVSGRSVIAQDVTLVERGYLLGDGVRSGVFDLAPRALTRLFRGTEPSNSAPSGDVSTYRTVFEGMYEKSSMN